MFGSVNTTGEIRSKKIYPMTAEFAKWGRITGLVVGKGKEGLWQVSGGGGEIGSSVG